MSDFFWAAEALSKVGGLKKKREAWQNAGFFPIKHGDFTENDGDFYGFLVDVWKLVKKQLVGETLSDFDGWFDFFRWDVSK